MMDANKAHHIAHAFRVTYGGPNHLTPIWLSYYETKQYFIEVCRSRSVDNILYGVTVITKTNQKTNKSRGFTKYSDVTAYIDTFEPMETPNEQDDGL